MRRYRREQWTRVSRAISAIRGALPRRAGRVLQTQLFFPSAPGYRMGFRCSSWHGRESQERDQFMRKALFTLLLLLSPRPLLAQSAPEGVWQGYDGEWRHVSSQLLALADAMPEEKFAWRPAPGVRSTSEVFMHIVLANF